MDLHTGYYYAIERMGAAPVSRAIGTWVRWPACRRTGRLLYTREPRTELPEALRPIRERSFPPARDRRGLEAASFDLPRAGYNPATRTLRVTTGAPSPCACNGATRCAPRWPGCDGFRRSGTPACRCRCAKAGLRCCRTAWPACRRANHRRPVTRSRSPPGCRSDLRDRLFRARIGRLARPAPGSPHRFPFYVEVRAAEPFRSPASRAYAQLYPLDFSRRPTSGRRRGRIGA